MNDEIDLNYDKEVTRAWIGISYDRDNSFSYDGVIVFVTGNKRRDFHHFNTGDPVGDYWAAQRFARRHVVSVTPNSDCFQFAKDRSGYGWGFVLIEGEAIFGIVPAAYEGDMQAYKPAQDARQDADQLAWLAGSIEFTIDDLRAHLEASGHRGYKAKVVDTASYLQYILDGLHLWQAAAIDPRSSIKGLWQAATKQEGTQDGK
jgi:hypothetical protein